jgi:hypothetical protein
MVENYIHCLKSTHIELIREPELSLKFLKTFRRNGKCLDSVPGEIDRVLNQYSLRKGSCKHGAGGKNC